MPDKESRRLEKPGRWGERGGFGQGRAMARCRLSRRTLNALDARRSQLLGLSLDETNMTFRQSQLGTQHFAGRDGAKGFHVRSDCSMSLAVHVMYWLGARWEWRYSSYGVA